MKPVKESKAPNPSPSSGHGGPRPGAGRKAKPLSEELQEILKKAWPPEKRKVTFEKAVAAADSGDIRAFGLLMAYGYGTPTSGDEIRIQEGVSTEIARFIAILKKGLSPTAWEEVNSLIEFEAE